jgi:hypothetical protein
MPKNLSIAKCQNAKNKFAKIAKNKNFGFRIFQKSSNFHPNKGNFFKIF